MEMRKSCVDCKATKTPLWRTGPAGPRSLCNACGIRYRKRKASDAEQQSSTSTAASISSHEGESIELKMVDFGRRMMIQRPESPVKKQRNNNGVRLGEVEEAAFLLLSLSCDPVFA